VLPAIKYIQISKNQAYSSIKKVGGFTMKNMLCSSRPDLKLKMKKLAAVVIGLLLIVAWQVHVHTFQVMAASKVSNLKQMEQVITDSIKKGEQVIAFQSVKEYTSVQIQKTLEKAAKSQNRLLSGSIQLSRMSGGQGEYTDYKISLSDDAFMEIKMIKSRRAAVKAAAKALKNAEYSTNYYSDDSYYEVFRQMLLEHPEYNYDTSVWKSSNGAYGYRRSNSMTKTQQKDKMEAAEHAALNAVKKCIKPGMTDKQKAKAIHNYIVRNCRYARYQNAFTAYGALVDGNAVCQGYAAAFNLMALKCGLQSMTVSGTTRGGNHAWTYAKIGRKYRYIDCTWDDTDGLGKGIVYNYFNVGADKMREEHVWDEESFPSSDIKYCKYFR